MTTDQPPILLPYVLCINTRLRHICEQAKNKTISSHVSTHCIKNGLLLRVVLFLPIARTDISSGIVLVLKVFIIKC